MAKLWFDAGGSVVSWDDDSGIFTPDPAVFTAPVLEYDPATNATLHSDLRVDRSVFQRVGAELRKNGTPVVINPDGEAETDRKAIPNRKAQIETYMGLIDLTVPPDLADIAGGSNAASIVAYINGTLVPRINQLDTLVQRTNANTNATQGIFQILRALAARFNWF